MLCVCIHLALCPVDSQLRQVQADHEAAEKKLGELRAEKERVSRQVRTTCVDLALLGTVLSSWSAADAGEVLDTLCS